MKTLTEYIEESLLDNIEDLESKSDDNVNRHGTIGEKYYISHLQDRFGFLKNMNVSKLKSYPCYWDDMYKKLRIEQIESMGLGNYEWNKPRHKPSSDLIKILNTFLSFKMDDVELGEYWNKNKIFLFFKSIFDIRSMEGRIRNLGNQKEMEIELYGDGKELLIKLLSK